MEYVNRKNEMQTNLDGLKTTCNLTELVLKGKDIELLLLKKQVQEKLSTLANVELKDLPQTVGKQIYFVPGNLNMGKLEDPDLLIDKKKGVQSVDESQKITLPNMVFSRKGNDLDIMAQTEKVIQKRTIATQSDIPSPKMATKTNVVDKGMVTEYPERYDRDNSSVCSNDASYCLETRGTETDVISTTEKAVNTPSRSLKGLTNQLQHVDSKDGSPSLSENGTGMESPATRRQRRRRERANQATHVAGTSTEGYV